SVEVYDDGGNDHLTVNVTSVTLEPGKVKSTDGLHVAFYSGFEDLFVRAPRGDSYVEVQGLPAAGQATILGAASVKLGTGRLSDITSAGDVLTDDGHILYPDRYRGSATTSLTIDDSKHTAPTSYVIGPSSITASTPGGSSIFNASFRSATVRFFTFYGGAGG